MTLRTSQPCETGLGPHTPSTCAGMCNQLLLLLLGSRDGCPTGIGGAVEGNILASSYLHVHSNVRNMSGSVRATSRYRVYLGLVYNTKGFIWVCLGLSTGFIWVRYTVQKGLSGLSGFIYRVYLGLVYNTKARWCRAAVRLSSVAVAYLLLCCCNGTRLCTWLDHVQNLIPLRQHNSKYAGT